MARDYAQLFEQVRVILNRHDLMGLIALGCPDDEYEPEVGRILPRLRSAREVADVEVIVQDVFTEMFSERQSEAGVAAAADEIWTTYSVSSD